MIDGLADVIEYGMFEKRAIDPSALRGLQCDLFVSAYNASERVGTVFAEVGAGVKHWVVHREYQFDATTLPHIGQVFSPVGDEAEFWLDYLSATSMTGNLAGLDIVVDITGMLRPHVLTLLRVLQINLVHNVRMLYSEPHGYQKAEKTSFALGAVSRVRQVRGYEGAHNTSTFDGDLLVIGTGYDDSLIRHVADSRALAKKLQLFGLPSLQPQMYQENHLRVSEAAESLGVSSDRDWLFAPANDPFATASVVQRAVRAEAGDPGVKNLYLSPLGTKPQVLGFGLFYLWECFGAAASAILPFSAGYTQESSIGLARVWEYRFDLP